MIHIRRCCLIYLAVATTASTACKKDYPGNATAPAQPEKKVVVTTFAGDGSGSFADGPSLSAKFKSPIGVTVAADGTIYVADFSNHRIRKIAGGRVSTVAGNDTFGIVNGHGISSQFKSPYRIAVDADGNLYILDEGIPTVRKISPAADVTSYAGLDKPGFLNGSALTAQFQSDEEAIIADQQGDIYIGDTFNNLIRKISIAGQVSTIAGTGTEGFRDGDQRTAQFRYPVGIAFDKQGNMYIADEGNFCIRKITTDGLVSTFAGSGMNGNTDGGPSLAQFNFINDMVADSRGNLYIADDNRIRKVTPLGIVSTIAGSTPGYADGDGASAKFHGVGGLGIDTQDNIYVADIVNNRIRKISFE